jgi:hypothetical protein
MVSTLAAPVGFGLGGGSDSTTREQPVRRWGDSGSNGHGEKSQFGAQGGTPPDSLHIMGEMWPELGKEGRMENRGAKRLTLAPGGLNPRVDFSEYRPTTEGGRKFARIQLESEIKQHLFCSPSDRDHMIWLEGACNQLEATMDRMQVVIWGVRH